MLLFQTHKPTLKPHLTLVETLTMLLQNMTSWEMVVKVPRSDWCFQSWDANSCQNVLTTKDIDNIFRLNTEGKDKILFDGV